METLENKKKHKSCYEYLQLLAIKAAGIYEITNIFNKSPF